MRRKWLIVSVIAVLALGAIGVGIYFWRYTPEKAEARHDPGRTPEKPAAPPDLEKLRNTFGAGLAALEKKDGAEAAKQLSSFDFGGRAVEEYRLFLLGQAYALTKDAASQRATLAKLWARGPQMVSWETAAAQLATLYGDAGDFHGSARVASSLATRSETPNAGADARWQTFESRFYSGDLAGAFYAVRNVGIKHPRAPQAGDALDVVRAISGAGPGGAIRLTDDERLERAVGLLRDGDPQGALDELDALAPDAPPSMREPLNLNRGLALYQLRRFEDAIRVLDPLGSGPYRIAIPALYHAAKSYRVLSTSINPTVTKTVTQRQQVGTVKVKQGKGKKAKTVTKPKFANVSRNVQLVDLAKKAKKEQYDRLAVERLKDLLSLPLAQPVRVEVLNSLIELAEAKNQDAYEQQLVQQLVKVDPLADPALQHFWDKAWAAYARGDLATAKPLLLFIRDTYTNPNVKRQATYWYAKSLERGGDKAGAMQIYQTLANAPYDDVYALNSEARGAKRQQLPPSPFATPRPDWREIAEKSMPPELRLAYELTALNDVRDARAELAKNTNAKNQQLADALNAELFNSEGNLLEMYRTLRRAFPTLATVEQDSVPPYFLRMYYPIKYEKSIRKHAQQFGVDPYLIMALCLQESYYNPRAKSRVGATGLMQLMPPTAKELNHRLHGRFAGTPHLENPDTNVELGSAYFKQLVNLFNGQWQLAVASYNGGQGNVMKWRRAAPGKPMDEFLESIPFPETRNYVKRVTLLSSTYRRMDQQ